MEWRGQSQEAALAQGWAQEMVLVQASEQAQGQAVAMMALVAEQEQAQGPVEPLPPP